MSGYEVTSPHGKLPYHSWSCVRCTAESGGTGCGRELIRAAAANHVERTGHSVIVVDGTSEHLHGLATTAEAAEAAR